MKIRSLHCYTICENYSVCESVCQGVVLAHNSVCVHLLNMSNEVLIAQIWLFSKSVLR